MNLSRTKLTSPVAPEKGSFPLDHFDECRQAMDGYIKCMKDFEGVSRHCEAEAKGYLACRMDNGLMAKEPMENLGFQKEEKK